MQSGILNVALKVFCVNEFISCVMEFADEIDIPFMEAGVKDATDDTLNELYGLELTIHIAQSPLHSFFNH